MIHRAWLAVPAALLSCIAVAERAPADRVAVLITDWTEPEGFDDLYRKEVVKRSFGSRAESADEPCTENFVGKLPTRVQMGLVPTAVGFKTPGLEGVYDSMGLYRLSKDGTTYVSIYDPKITLDAKSLPSTPGLITPAKDIKKPVSRSLWAIDPRDGTNYLADVVMIGAPTRGPGPNPLAMPNGVRDADEFSYAAGITDFSVLHEDLTPHLSPTTVKVMDTTTKELVRLFGDQVDVRLGAYAPTEGQSRSEDDVALDFAKEGFRRMVVTRETTDNNNYANNFMTRGYVERALCKQGLKDEFAFQQSRQVGRTPEYNLALLHVAKKNLDQVQPGKEIAVLYTTYGLPFPGRDVPGPFSAPHPWAKEVYHENAYNNYISFKRYLDGYYGDRFKLVFNPEGKSGDARLDNYYSYGLVQPDDFKAMDPAVKFRSLRDNIDLAKKQGRKEILAVLSHWYHNGRDPLLAVRILQKIPLNTREDIRNGKFWVDWCEKVDSSDPVPCDPQDASLVHLQYSETFDSWAKEFGIGYAQNIRSAVERFGVFPSATNLQIVTRGPIDREAGGTVAVKTGKLKGAAFTIAKDAHPGQPESFTQAESKPFMDPADNFVSAWDSFEGYIGTQDVALDRLAKHSKPVSDAILYGPYRTIVNRPATITVPVRVAKGDLAALRPFVWNDVSEDWDPVFVPAGGKALTYDAKSKTVSFDTQVLGVFAIAATPAGWTPRAAVTHRYHARR